MRRPALGGRAAVPAAFTRSLRRLLRGVGIGAAGRGSWVWAGTPSSRIERVRDYVERHAGEPLRLDDLARVAGLSRYHFARVFRQEVGETPWAYVRRARARRAAELLRDGRTPAEAAHEAGFADQSHLTRTLRRLEGRTPGEVRRAASRHTEGRPDRPSEKAPDRKNVQDR